LTGFGWAFETKKAMLKFNFSEMFLYQSFSYLTSGKFLGKN
jgi:hypothetical protein